MKTSFACTAVLAATVSFVAAEDHLYSERRLQKRYIDEDGNWNQSFFHVNDIHARLDEFRNSKPGSIERLLDYEPIADIGPGSSGTECEEPERGCYGGYARISTVVNERRPVLNSSLFLNAGDEFQGTLFYTYYGGEKIAETLNQLGVDGMTLGNHEFDGGDDELGAFLENLTFPILGANIQSGHPVLNTTIKPFHVYEDFDLAVIGVTTADTPNIANPGEDTLFSDPIEAVQNTVNLIRETTNITRIAALTHIGYENDQALAQNTTGLYLIMGGHSHTPLGTGEDEDGPYPTIVRNMDDEEVFIVTAYRWGEYLGYIDVTYDAEGRILEYHGGPIHLTNTTEQNATLQAQIDEWRGPFEEFAAVELGITNVVLEQSTCQQEECTLGNFMADAMLAYRRNSSADVDFALINAGGIRATIDEGPITRGEVLTSFPFGNAVVEITLSGQEVWDVLEGIFTGINTVNGEEVTSFVQVSQGIQIEYNPENDDGSKLVSVTIGNSTLDLEAEYQIVTLDFLAGGGDNFFGTAPFDDAATLDTQDEVLVRYIEQQSPVDIAVEGRISVVEGMANDRDSGSSSGSGAGNGSSNGTEAGSSEGGSARSTVASAAIAAGMLASLLALL